MLKKCLRLDYFFLLDDNKCTDLDSHSLRRRRRQRGEFCEGKPKSFRKATEYFMFTSSNILCWNINYWVYAWNAFRKGFAGQCFSSHSVGFCVLIIVSKNLNREIFLSEQNRFYVNSLTKRSNSSKEREMLNLGKFCFLRGNWEMPPRCTAMCDKSRCFSLI